MCRRTNWRSTPSPASGSGCRPHSRWPTCAPHSARLQHRWSASCCCSGSPRPWFSAGASGSSCSRWRSLPATSDRWIQPWQQHRCCRARRGANSNRCTRRSRRCFASHAAHSLRTPLAGLSAQLELAHLQASGELKPRLALALDAARRLNGVVAGLLAMARTHGPIAWQQFDARELGKVALGRRIASDVSALEMAAPLHGNLDLLATAVINLVDNAARHGASKVWIQSLPSAQVQQLRVTDDGAHGGQVSVDCADSGAPGFCVQIAWPHTPDAAPDNAPTH
ncbi:MAG: HAMP domain-containing histidine kinase [Burkholderiaceae bacterium]|nr:HAMP domain-containing histidine kinase [Burkholderiaceae bacterium]